MKYNSTPKINNKNKKIIYNTLLISNYYNKYNKIDFKSIFKIKLKNDLFNIYKCINILLPLLSSVITYQVSYCGFQLNKLK